MMALKEIDIFGIYVAPAALYVAIGVVLFAILRGLIVYFNLDRFVWHPSLCSVALLVSVISLVTIVAISVVG